MDIDLVYLWVDGRDPVWAAKKCSYMPVLGVVPVQNDVTGDCRYMDNDELKYSLRSVEKYAPWIRRIYIVTDNQCPAWLDTSNPRVRVVDHREIMPEEILPIFNSTALEWYLDRIPGLAEHFLLANDDTMFGAPVTPEFFFDTRGLPIFRLKKQSLKRHLDRGYPAAVYRSQQEIFRRYGTRFTLAPHHNIDAYCKSFYGECKERFAPEVASTSQHRFREHGDLHRSVVTYNALACGKGVEKPISRFNGADTWRKKIEVLLGRAYYCDSRCIPLSTPVEKIRQILTKYNPRLFCINDGDLADDRARERIGAFFRELYPEKSGFER